MSFPWYDIFEENEGMGIDLRDNHLACGIRIDGSRNEVCYIEYIRDNDKEVIMRVIYKKRGEKSEGQLIVFAKDTTYEGQPIRGPHRVYCYNTAKEWSNGKDDSDLESAKQSWRMEEHD